MTKTLAELAYDFPPEFLEKLLSEMSAEEILTLSPEELKERYLQKQDKPLEADVNEVIAKKESQEKAQKTSLKGKELEKEISSEKSQKRYHPKKVRQNLKKKQKKK